MPQRNVEVAQKKEQSKRGLVKSCGLFWLREEVDWKPGNGNRKAFHLLGRIGAKRPGIRIADFRRQQGIYILYAPHGPYYVGLTVAQGLGKRLRDHTEDSHKDKWDRFSWFGFQKVLKKKDPDGICEPAPLGRVALASSSVVIHDIEALLIKAMGLHNKAQMTFSSAEEWTQIKDGERANFLDKVRPK